MKGIVIVISCSVDGRSISRLTKSEFLKRLQQNYWGETPPKFAKEGEVPDLDYFTGLIVINGDVIEPKPVQVVTEYTLP